MVDTPDKPPLLPAAVEVAAYRIVQEALANVVRHSGAATCRVAVSVDRARSLLCLQIVDVGDGLPALSRVGEGMVSMRERTEEPSGTCTISARPCGGTSVIVELPSPFQQDVTDGTC